MRSTLQRIGMAIIGFGLAGSSFAFSAEPLRFNRDVRPILSSACFGCHGPGKQKAGLRLDQAKAAYAKDENTQLAAIVPKNSNDSEAIRRIFSDDETVMMPPAVSHKKLTAEQKNTLKRWVDEGAVYESHWSLMPIAKPNIPNQSRAVANPIDAFLNDRHQQLKLPANPEADRSTLIRRVAFALTGLPPSLKEIDLYINDQKDGAFERMVDRYFTSPHYGEEMARHWLDLARYADTHGLHLDNERGIWPYRDWVVRAFNENKPFDVFTVEQLAGDLLSNPTKDQLVATGFNRCNVTTGEGGSIDAEWYYRNAVDRTAVACETWLGLTAGCAQCHDHKFDPISQKEFYSLYAFFYSAAGSPLDGNVARHDPVVKLTTPEQDRKLFDYDQRLQALNVSITAATKRYVDPALVATLAGTAGSLDSNEIRMSFIFWVRARGGVDAGKLPKEIQAIFTGLKPEQQPNSNQLKQLKDYFLRSICPATDVILDPLIKAKETLTAERNQLDQSIPASMIFRDMPSPRQAFVMLRGQYDKPGDRVEPGVPSALPALAAAKRKTRLDFARWVVSPENPLTARVYVNRLWQQLFGTGLVKSSNDFGMQGDSPSHPELLDWLAAHFRDSGWDTRALVRVMVTSQAFRRSAKATPEMLKIDPDNRNYFRGPRFRLDAEQVRDQALFVSGLLNETVGGKGVKPYQPDNIWEPVAFTGSNTQFYKRDSGQDLYRRSIYTFYKRTAPPPYLVNFDMPNREQPCTRRDRSNTPLQSLQVLNDIQHVEAARVFAERVITHGGTTDDDRLNFAFRIVLARTPSEKEKKILTSEFALHLSRYTKTPDDAKKLISLGESKPKPGMKPELVAAYTLIVSTILNLDESLTRN